MLANKSMAAAPDRQMTQGFMRWSSSPALHWILLGYAVLAIAIGWAFAASRSHADYERTLEVERRRLRDVAATLQVGTLAMLNDGVGAAVAGANELQSEGGLIRADRVEIIKTLQKQLTGGNYRAYAASWKMRMTWPSAARRRNCTTPASSSMN